MSVLDTYNRDAVVEQRLAEDDDLEDIVDVERLEHGEDGDRVDCSEQRREDQSVK